MQTSIENAGAVERAHRAEKSTAQKARENAESMLRNLVDQELENSRSPANLAVAIIDQCPQALKIDDDFLGVITRMAGRKMDARETELNPAQTPRQSGPRRGKARGQSTAAATRGAKAAAAVAHTQGATTALAWFVDYKIADFDCYIGDMTQEKLKAWGRRGREHSFIAEQLCAGLPDSESRVSQEFTAKAVEKIIKQAKDIR
jgi:hypothetical protein